MKTRSLPNGGWCVALRSILFVTILTLFSGLVSAAVLTPATGGSAISADTANSAFTALTNVIIAENASGEINTSLLVLRAPAGFAFDTNATVRVLVTRTNGSGQDNRNINHAANGTLLAPNVTADTITFNVTHASKQGVTNALTWHNISIRPTQGTPLANGSIVLEILTSVLGVPNGSSAGTLAMITGAPAQITLAPASASVAQNQTQNYTATLRDRAGNLLADVTNETNLSAANGTWANNSLTIEAKGTWAVFGTWNAFNATTQITVNDVTPPVILLLGHNPAEVDEGKAYGDDGAQANDTVDGVLDGAIMVIGSVDTDRPGTYTLTYTVNDSSGNNASATRTVIVREDTSGNRRGREFSHFAAAPAASAPSTASASTGTSGSSAASGESGTGATGSEASASGETSSETSTAETAASVAAETAPRNEMPGTVESESANPITGAVTGTQRSTTWLWVAGAGVLVAGLFVISGKYRNRKPDFSP